MSRKPITSLLKLADRIESGELEYDQALNNYCIVGLANREILHIDSDTPEEDVFAEGFGIDVQTATRIYINDWGKVLGRRYDDKPLFASRSKTTAVAFIREFVKIVNDARSQRRKFNRANRLVVKNGEVSA
jgi:hypothetical protein